MPHPNCACCHGKGYYETKIKNLGTREWEWHFVPCDYCTTPKEVTKDDPHRA